MRSALTSLLLAVLCGCATVKPPPASIPDHKYAIEESHRKSVYDRTYSVNIHERLMAQTAVDPRFSDSKNFVDGGRLRALFAPSGGARMVNMSCLNTIADGGNLIAGFVVSGAQETVLIRGVGPGLAQFGVAGALATPTLTLYDGSSNVIATDTGWGNPIIRGASMSAAVVASATAQIMSSAGAFTLSANSADCAMVATLTPGNYSAGVSGGPGFVLVEIYELSIP